MSNEKRIVFENEGLSEIVKGVEMLARTVGSTLGPGGRNVIFDNYGFPLATKDGVTVARQVALKDKLQNIGVQMVKQVANKTCNDAGDGTTTATILASAILREGYKKVASGMNRIDVVRGITKATEIIIDYIKENIRQEAVTNEIIHKIAVVSSNWDDEIGNIIGDAIAKVGVDGTINLEDSPNNETTLSFIDGIKFNRGYINPYLINNEARQIVEMNNPYILLYNGQLNDFASLIPICNQIRQENASLLIVADDFDPSVIQSMVANVQKRVLNIAAIKAPWYKDMRLYTMDDLAIYLGTKYFDDSTISGNMGIGGLRDLKIERLGRCKKVVITGYTTTFIDGCGSQDDIQTRITHLKHQMKDKELSSDEVKNLEIRVNQLCGSVATVAIGASSEVENQEKRDRIDDAIRATRAAISEGFVPGGSYAYLHALNSSKFKEMTERTDADGVGANIVKTALKAPFLYLMKNAGLEDDALKILETIRDGQENLGYNIKTKTYGNLLEMGVIDPYKVTRTALQNAASVAGVILTSEAVIIDEKMPDMS